MGLQVMGRDRVARRRKGLQPCSLVIGARDDSFAGDPCCRGLHLRGRAGDPSPRPERKDHRCRARCLGGGAGGDGGAIGSPVSRARWQGLAGLVSASSLPGAVQPAAAPTGVCDRGRAAASRRACRLEQPQNRRRHPDRGCQPPGLRLAQRVRRRCRLRLLPLEEPVRVGSTPHPGDRPERRAARLHARRRQPERVRAGA